MVQRVNASANVTSSDRNKTAAPSIACRVTQVAPLIFLQRVSGATTDVKNIFSYSYRIRSAWPKQRRVTAPCQSRSTTIAKPMAPAAQTVIRPNFLSRLRISLRRVTVIRPPVAPKG